MRRLAVVGVAMALVTVGVTWRLAPLFWSPVSHGSVRLGNELQPHARLYRLSESRIMVALGERIYVVRRDEGAVGLTSANYFWFVCALGALAKDRPDPSVNLNSAKANFMDPQLRLGSRTASFRDAEGRSIHLSW
jgi:hypothetical protein